MSHGNPEGYTTEILSSGILDINATSNFGRHRSISATTLGSTRYFWNCKNTNFCNQEQQNRYSIF